MLVILVASLALAQSVSEDELAHLAISGHTESLVGVPWSGNHADPLAYMVDWASVIDASVCWVGREPPGWSDVSSMYRLIVVNETNQFVQLWADDGLIDVVRPQYNGSLQLPAVIVGDTANGPRRLTALQPGATCYGLLPGKSAESASHYGWSVQGVRFDHAGPAGTWLYAGGLWLYDKPLFEGAQSDKAKVFWRGQRETTVVFRDRDFVP